MILAERQHLEDLMAQQAVEIRIKEEKILSKSFRTLSSLATYLAASAFAILRATPTYLTKNHSYLDANASRDQQKGTRPENDPETVWLVTQTEGLAALALCFCVLVLAVSSWCLIFGTDLAFRGADQGSMTRALDGLYAERKYAARIPVLATVVAPLPWRAGCPLAVCLLLKKVALVALTLFRAPLFNPPRLPIQFPSTRPFPFSDIV